MRSVGSLKQVEKTCTDDFLRCWFCYCVSRRAQIRFFTCVHCRGSRTQCPRAQNNHFFHFSKQKQEDFPKKRRKFCMIFLIFWHFRWIVCWWVFGGMDEDENLSMLLSMGFPDIEEAQRALRAAKNDLNEAVSKDHAVLLCQTIIPWKPSQE